jgi:hypothetical protein
MRFQWEEPTDHAAPCDVVLDPETTEAVIALMAGVLTVVVRAAEEVADER